MSGTERGARIADYLVALNDWQTSVETAQIIHFARPDFNSMVAQNDGPQDRKTRQGAALRLPSAVNLPGCNNCMQHIRRACIDLFKSNQNEDLVLSLKRS